MKRLIVFGSIALLTGLFSSCKKEVIQPNSRTEVSDCPSGASTKMKKAGNTNTGTITTTGNSETGATGGITDPNDDDYSNRKPTKTKNSPNNPIIKR